MHGHSLFYNKIFVAYIWAKFTFQISLLTVLKVWSMNRVSNLQQVIGITHGNNENGLIAGLCLLSHWWAKPVGLGETWSTPHPTTTAWIFFTEKPPCPLNSRGEEGRNDALDSSEAPTRLLVHLEKRSPGQLAPFHRELQTPLCHIASFPRQQMSHSCRAGLQLHHTTWTTYLMYWGCFCRHLGKIF